MAFLALGPGLSGEFLNFDDPRLILGNPAFHESFFKGILHLLDPTQRIAEVYLPVSYLSLFLDWNLFGPQGAFGFHVHSLLLEGGVSWLLFLLLRDLGASRWVALLGSLPLVLHPLLAESVSWISSRKDLLAGFFGLWALLQGRRVLRGEGRAFWVYFLTILACYSKGSALVLPFLGALLWIGPLGIKKADLKKEGCTPKRLLLFVTGICALVAFHHLLHSWAVGTAGFSGNPRAIPGTFLHYLSLLFYPDHLAVFYPRNETLAVFETNFTAKLLFLGILIVGAVFLLWKRGLGLWVGAGILFSLASLLPFNGFLPATALPAADRYLYLALPGLGLVLAGLVSLSPRNLRSWVSGFLILLFSFWWIPKARARSFDFTRSDRLWESNLKVFPEDGVSWFNLGLFHLQDVHGTEKKALPMLEKALAFSELPQHRLRAATTLFVLHRRRGEDGKSLERLDLAIRIVDHLPLQGNVRNLQRDLRLDRASSLFRLGRDEEGDQCVAEVLQLDPQNPEALGWKVLREIEKYQGRKPRSFPESFLKRLAGILRAGSKRGGVNPHYLLALAEIERLRGNATSALGMMERFRKQHPGASIDVYLALARTYLAENVPLGAIQILRKGLSIWSFSPALSFELGRIFEGLEQLSSAESLYRRALKVRPLHPGLRKALARVLATQARRMLATKSSDEYRAQVQEARRMDPKLPVLDFLDAHIQRSKKKIRKAFELASRAATALPNDEEVQMFRLKLLRDLGYLDLFQNRKSAFRRFRTLVDEAPKDFPLASVMELLKSEYLRRVNQGEKALLGGEGLLAEKAFLEALELFPDQPTALTKLGLSQYLQKHFHQAIATLGKAVTCLIGLGADPGLALLYQIKALLAVKEKGEAKKRAELLNDPKTGQLFVDSAFRERILQALK
jgi:tetratricopeptide (TPR) repeat protein